MKHKQHHKHPSDAVAALTGLDLLRNVTTEDLGRLRRNADLIDTPADHVLDRIGTRARQFVGIVDGYVRGVRRDGYTVVLGPGDQFGAAELIADEPHAMTYTTATPATLVVVFGPAFRAVARHIPDVGRRINAAPDAIVQFGRPADRERPLVALAG